MFLTFYKGEQPQRKIAPVTRITAVKEVPAKHALSALQTAQIHNEPIFTALGFAGRADHFQTVYFQIASTGGAVICTGRFTGN
jgi:hypothetical protein